MFAERQRQNFSYPCQAIRSIVIRVCLVEIKRGRFVQTIGLLVAKLVLGTSLSASVAEARDAAYDRLWQDPEIEARINTGIKTYRMGYGTLRFVDAQGKPISNVEVEVAQNTHDFLFGANIFMLNGFPTASENRRYEELFKALFNYASAPFYWSDLEPEPGKVRFTKDSPVIYRRPPPDAVVEFCEANNITIKGHTLIWDKWYPAWLPKEQAEVTRLMRRRFEQIAGRYDKRIHIWDVVNEALKRNPDVVLPKDYVYTAVKEAERHFSPDSRLLINEVTTESWFNFHHETTPYYLLIQNLLMRGARVDAIGFQCHFFSEQQYADVLAGKVMRPADILRVLDQFAKLSRPLHITEITIPTLPNTPEGEQDQAAVTRNLYRLWFSHPNVEAITWWNAVDETAVPGEDKWRGGFVRRDFSPKPSSEVLNNLINKEWRTRLALRTKENSAAKFQGYYGKYTVSAKHEGKILREQIHVSRTGTNDFTLRF